MSARSHPCAELREWVAALPGVVAELAERWSLELSEAFQPGGSCSWVAPVRDPAGRELVLKVGWRHDEAEHEAAGLSVWAGRGSVLLHAACTRGNSSALLLERCRPGTAASSLPERQQDLVIAGLLGQLWSASTDVAAFRPLSTMCEAWASEFEQRLLASPGPLDPGLARAGMELLRGLPATTGREVLLATDLHAGNVLAAEREPWLVIDPKPYVGDPAYDSLQHMLNCEERLNADPAGLAARMAELLELDAERVRRWLFARCVQESIDQPALGRVAGVLAPS